MVGILPDGEPVACDGSLPPHALKRLGEAPFAIYVHVPFCASRCGYCDFNTYTAAELGGASQDTYADAAVAEIRLARAALGSDRDLPVRTVFFGGGTPTLLPPPDLARVLRAVDGEFGLAPDAEVTTEANPESVGPAALNALRDAGFTRVSLGMQSARSHVLAVLDRRHTPNRAERCVSWARAAGFGHVNLDLIYGTPGETDEDWAASLAAAAEAGPDHVSAYALTVEDGTRLAARVRHGEFPEPDDDTLADRYLMAEQALSAAGLTWYEISNWAAGDGGRCRHNLGYWTGGDWWGVGPGAHSHIGGVRWWNVKHPRAYAERVAAGVSPGQGREVLDEDAQRSERVLLRLRLADGCPLGELDEAGLAAAKRAVGDGLLEPGSFDSGRAVLTLRGRLLADAVARDLLP